MPRKHCRTQVRSRGNRVRTEGTRMVRLFRSLQSTTDWQQWAFWTVAWTEVAKLVAVGEAEPVTRLVASVEDGDTFEDVELVGYRALVPVRWDRESPATLTFATMLAVGNQHGLKKDVHLTRGEREHVEKFAVWALIGDTRAVAVRPAMSVADQRRAEALMPEFRAPRCREQVAA